MHFFQFPVRGNFSMECRQLIFTFYFSFVWCEKWHKFKKINTEKLSQDEGNPSFLLYFPRSTHRTASKPSCILPILNSNIFYTKHSFNKFHENHCLVNDTRLSKNGCECHVRQVAGKESCFMKKLVKITIILSLWLHQPKSKVDSVNAPCDL